MNEFPKLAGHHLKILRFNFRKNIINKQSKQNILGNAITVAETVPQRHKLGKNSSPIVWKANFTIFKAKQPTL